MGRVSWRVATVTEFYDETATARTLLLRVPTWPGHVAGQHVDVRLTAADGYSATRSYSIASAPSADRVDLTVDELPDGEVSPYLVRELMVGDPLEVRGPVGGWFVWRPEQSEPVQLIAGGSGIVPLMCILRTHARAGSEAPMRLLYSARSPESMFYRSELARLEAEAATDVTFAYTRAVPADWTGAPRRVDALLLSDVTLPAAQAPTCYVCGPTAFVEAVSTLLIDAGHEPGRIRTERFGPSGGHP
jgi:ferredoxin-NADP reductase